VRLRRSTPGKPGWTRRRSGKGFVYLDENGTRLSDSDLVQRIRELVIPPAWQEVWICPWPNGHLQAVGTDVKGRKQYLYHPQWREDRDHDKHRRILGFAKQLPQARVRVAEDLELSGMPRERTLAIAFRLLDLGLFRIGGEAYAQENNSFGLATLRREHVHVRRGGTVEFSYPAKSGVHRTFSIKDELIAEAVSSLKRRRGGGEELMAWRRGRTWVDMGSADIADYVKDVVSKDSSAKDFRTWHATVLAAVAFAGKSEPTSATALKRTVAQVMREVSGELGNTPAVCRASYVDPRVVKGFEQGTTIRAALRKAHKGGADVEAPGLTGFVGTVVGKALGSLGSGGHGRLFKTDA
jgi:DNA topoisomerase I